MNLIAGLSRSLFSVRYYREVVQASVSKGFLYLALWSLIMASVVSVIAVTRFLPDANRFMEWFRQDMPVVQLTDAGISIDKPSPYAMQHPRYGHVAMFDMNRTTEVSRGDIGDAWIFATATKLYIRHTSRNEIRVYDLISPDMKGKDPLVLDAALVKKFENMIKPWAVVILAVLTFIFFFIWKLIAALFYSLIAMVINLFREPKLSYEALLNVCFFAMTATCWGSLLELCTGIIRIPFGLLGGLIITTTYLYLGVKFTEEPSAPVYV